jgi:fructokinase
MLIYKPLDCGRAVMEFDVVGLGEVLWDLLPVGTQLGGAPANFAYHAHALGAQSHVISRVGNDDPGREIIRRFREMGVRDDGIEVDDTAPTGTATVEVSGNGLVHFTVQENVAWDFIATTEETLAICRNTHAICFGSLAQRAKRSHNAIQQLVAATPPEALRVFDANLRQHFYSRRVIEESLKLANIVKLNDDEMPTLATMFGLSGSTESQILQLAKMFSLQVVALTRGANGSLLYQAESPQPARWADCPSRPVKVVDTVGAGDSFTAALVLGLLLKMNLDEINSIANDVARYVCSQSGATPPLPAEFQGRFFRTPGQQLQA